MNKHEWVQLTRSPDSCRRLPSAVFLLDSPDGPVSFWCVSLAPGLLASEVRARFLAIGPPPGGLRPLFCEPDPPSAVEEVLLKLRRSRWIPLAVPVIEARFDSEWWSAAV